MWPRIFGNPARSLGNPGGGASITYLFRVEFTTDDAAPLTSPYVGEVGSLTVVDSGNDASVAGGNLTIDGRSGDLSQPRLYASLARQSGLAVYFKYTQTNDRLWFQVGGVNTGASSVQIAMTDLVSIIFAIDASTSGQSVGAYSNGTAYELYMVVTPTTAYVLRKGGTFSTWSLLWMNYGVTADPVYALITAGQVTVLGNVDAVRARVLPAPFQDDYGLATVNKTSFTQALGSEIITNGSAPILFTGDNPNSWTVTGESAGVREVTEVASGGGAGTGAMRLFTTDATLLSIRQACAAQYLEYDVTISAVSGNGIQWGNSGLSYFAVTKTVTGRFRGIAINQGNDVFIRPLASNGNATLDSISYKALTLNNAVTMPADALIDYIFSLPASPVAGDDIHCLYRIEATGDELVDCWDAYLKRNDANSAWDARLDSIAARTRTNRIAVTGVGTPGAIRVSVTGNDHRMFTEASGAWTQRGGTVTNSSFASATLANTMATSNFTETRLAIYPRTNSAWDTELDRV